MLRIGARTCVIGLEDDIDARVAAFEEDAHAAFERHAAGEQELSPAPRVMLVPGLGSIAAGPDIQTASVRSEIAAHTHATVAATLDRFGNASWLSEHDVFAFEYWPLELYKLTLAPPPSELAGRIAVVTGAASGLGRDIACDLAQRGAHLVLVDIDGDGLTETSSGLDRAVTVCGDLTDAATIDRVVATAVTSFGGIDAVVFNAGAASIGALDAVADDEWQRSLELNLTSHFRLTNRVVPLLREQAIGGSLVYVASKNAFAPGAGFGSYSVAKAGLIQLMRIAALEGGGQGIRANAVNPDAIFGGSKLWSDEVRRQRADAHGVPLDELEAFYASRSLLGRPVTGGDVAEAVAFLVSDRSNATTGAVIPVDGGVAGAFPR
jgi:NAD(P)-dependent dehydrogenase (short-subunit alcohol dehydrogenase family)